MRERPILFSAPMVRALLAGTKTQTRRIVKPAPVADSHWAGGFYLPGRKSGPRAMSVQAPHIALACPYGAPGDRLWVRETFSDVYGDGGDERKRRESVMYRADGDTDPNVIGGAWTPSIHMPRWACRLVLEITGVRVERLQDISEADAIAEGIETMAEHRDGRPTGRALGLVHRPGIPPEWGGPIDAFSALWTSINGPGSWDANPWVWVVEFKRIGA